MSTNKNKLIYYVILTHIFISYSAHSYIIAPEGTKKFFYKPSIDAGHLPFFTTSSPIILIFDTAIDVNTEKFTERIMAEYNRDADELLITKLSQQYNLDRLELLSYIDKILSQNKIVTYKEIDELINQNEQK